MRDLGGRPSKLKNDHESDKVHQLGRLVGVGTSNTAEEDEREGSDDTERTN